MKILITGYAGFIGFHLVNKLIKNKNNYVVGIDNFNNYYDVNLKKKRNKILNKQSIKNFKGIKVDLNNIKKISYLFKKYKFDYVVHLAAQAGVRYSIKFPKKYFNSNIKGFFNILELCKEFRVKHLIIGSSSSVYGNSKKFPLSENNETNKPLSFYAATKKSNEVMSYSYSNIYKLPISALRFFTIYGPSGRPDMALFKFSDAINKNKIIKLYNKGDHYRDFTYIDDAIKNIIKIIKIPPKKDIPFRVINIANGKPEKLSLFIKLIEENLRKKSKVLLLPIQKGDVFKTHGDTKFLKKLVKNKTNTNIKFGVKKFIKWFKKYKSNVRI